MKTIKLPESTFNLFKAEFDLWLNTEAFAGVQRDTKEFKYENYYIKVSVRATFKEYQETRFENYFSVCLDAWLEDITLIEMVEDNEGKFHEEEYNLDSDQVKEIESIIKVFSV